MSATRFAIVGRGQVGTGLHRALRRAGKKVTLLSARGKTSPKSRHYDLVVLAVPDQAIKTAGASVLDRISTKAIVHCAGARSPEELSALRDLGVSVGAMHPLVSFASRTAPPRLDGTTFLIDGDAVAVRLSAQLARAVRAVPLRLPAHGAGYHAAAALVANGTAALAQAGVEILLREGFEQQAAERALGSLIGTVGENTRALGVPEALTGPVQRGDLKTIKRHRKALTKTSQRIYDSALGIIVACARKNGLSSKVAKQILSLAGSN